MKKKKKVVNMKEEDLLEIIELLKGTLHFLCSLYESNYEKKELEQLEFDS